MLNAFEDLRIGVLCSKRAPGLDALLRHPLRGSLYDIACVITTEPFLSETNGIEASGVPVMSHPMLQKKLVYRPQYDDVTAETLARLDVNLVVLLGYIYIVTYPLLGKFSDRVVNIHDSDLTLRKADGSRRYVGLHSTRDAIIAGEKQTRSTVHLVTQEIDAGPILAMSEPYPVAPFAREASVEGHVDIVRAYSYAHREWMMRDSWGPLLIRTIENLACGAVIEEAMVQ